MYFDYLLSCVFSSQLTLRKMYIVWVYITWIKHCRKTLAHTALVANTHTHTHLETSLLMWKCVWVSSLTPTWWIIEGREDVQCVCVCVPGEVCVLLIYFELVSPVFDVIQWSRAFLWILTHVSLSLHWPRFTVFNLFNLQCLLVCQRERWLPSWGQSIRAKEANWPKETMLVFVVENQKTQWHVTPFDYTYYMCCFYKKSSVMT